MMQTFRKLVTMRSIANKSLGLAKSDKPTFPALEFSVLKRSLSEGVSEKKATSAAETKADAAMRIRMMK